MARTIIEIEGKKFQVCEKEFPKHPCKGCYFYDGVYTSCPGYNPPCIEFDDATGTIHILKKI